MPRPVLDPARRGRHDPGPSRPPRRPRIAPGPGPIPLASGRRRDRLPCRGGVVGSRPAAPPSSGCSPGAWPSTRSGGSAWGSSPTGPSPTRSRSWPTRTVPGRSGPRGGSRSRGCQPESLVLAGRRRFADPGPRWVGVNVRRLAEDVSAPWEGAGDKCQCFRGSTRGLPYPFGDVAPGVPALLCEGEFDALVGWQEAGWVVNAVTVGGAQQTPSREALATLDSLPRVAAGLRPGRDREPRGARLVATRPGQGEAGDVAAREGPE